MLRAPIINIRLSQMSYFILISLCLTGSILLLFNGINLSIITDPEYNPHFQENISSDRLIVGPVVLSSFFTSLLWAFIPLTIGVFIIVFYIPPTSSLGISKSIFRKESQLKRFPLPVRAYTFPIKSVNIRISRKLSSLKGLILREMNFSIIFPLNYPDKKRVFDFLMGEKIKYTKTSVIMQKTVEIRNIPLLIVRTRAILENSVVTNDL